MMKVCHGCKKEIKTKYEKYTHVEDWDREQFVKDSWWHLSCFCKAMNRDLKEIEKAAGIMLGKAIDVYKILPKELKGDDEFVI